MTVISFPGTANEQREAPNNLEAEQALIGAILINNDAFDRVQSFLKPDHFYEPLHARMYERMGEMIRAGSIANPITLKPHFENDETMISVGGIAYLAHLIGAAPTVVNADEYGRMIFDLAQRRKLIHVAEDIVAGAYDFSASTAEQLIESAEQMLADVTETTRYSTGFQRFGKAISDSIDMAAAAYQRDGGLSGLSTGLLDLDNMTGGLQPSDLIILAGRPSMGKTALATNIAFHVASNYRAEHDTSGRLQVLDGGVVAFFSLEMSAEQLATRILSEQSAVSSERIRRGRISEDEFTHVVQVARKIDSLPIYIDASGGLTIAQVAARTRRIKRQRGLGLVVVDYLQLLSGSRRNGEGRVQEITEITTGLKGMAKDLNVPVLALSQLSRQVESREDKRPQLSDLRESGSIEQDADVVMFVYREEYYLARQEPKPNSSDYFEWQSSMSAASGIAEVIVGKQRHGPVGIARLQFDSQLTRFRNLSVDNLIL